MVFARAVRRSAPPGNSRRPVLTPRWAAANRAVGDVSRHGATSPRQPTSPTSDLTHHHWPTSPALHAERLDESILRHQQCADAIDMTFHQGVRQRRDSRIVKSAPEPFGSGNNTYARNDVSGGTLTTGSTSSWERADDTRKLAERHSARPDSREHHQSGGVPIEMSRPSIRRVSNPYAERGTSPSIGLCRERQFVQYTAGTLWGRSPSPAPPLR